MANGRQKGPFLLLKTFNRYGSKSKRARKILDGRIRGSGRGEEPASVFSFSTLRHFFSLTFSSRNNTYFILELQRWPCNIDWFVVLLVY